MKGILLDTNVLSEFSRIGVPNPKVKDWLKSNPSNTLYVSILTLAEILRGIELLPDSKRRIDLEKWLHAELPKSLDPQRIFPINRSISDRWAYSLCKITAQG